MNLKLPEDFESRWKILEKKYKSIQDPWGLDIKKTKILSKYLYQIYAHYFRVRFFADEDYSDKQFIAIGNHTGQLPFDALMVEMAFFLKNKNPVLLRGMIEKFLAGFPLLGKLSAQGGSVLGDRKNAEFLLKQKESLLVFPEGVRGISKSTSKHYQIQNFTRGFFRIALKHRTPILPIAIVGAEELYPYVMNVKPLAKFFNLPAFPITPTFPFLGPLGMLPLPSPIDIYVGKLIPIPENISKNATDEEIDVYVEKIQKQIDQMMQKGLKNKRKML